MVLAAEPVVSVERQERTRLNMDAIVEGSSAETLPEAADGAPDHEAEITAAHQVVERLRQRLRAAHADPSIEAQLEREQSPPPDEHSTRDDGARR